MKEKVHMKEKGHMKEKENMKQKKHLKDPLKEHMEVKHVTKRLVKKDGANVDGGSQNMFG